MAFTFFLLDDFMPKVAPFWSQKGPIAAYYERRRSPDERLCAYMLYWRGETFYTSNEIYEGPAEERTVFDQEGRRRPAEGLGRAPSRPARVLHLRAPPAGAGHPGSPPEARASFQIVDENNNKFSLAQADL